MNVYQQCALHMTVVSVIDYLREYSFFNSKLLQILSNSDKLQLWLGKVSIETAAKLDLLST